MDLGEPAVREPVGRLVAGPTTGNGCHAIGTEPMAWIDLAAQLRFPRLDHPIVCNRV